VADLEAMVRAARDRGLPVLLPDVLPWNNGWPDAEPTIRALNRLIHALAERVEGVTLLPFHDTLEDPERPGRMHADWTDDGNHPSVAGHRRLAEQAFRLP
jgi:lysophospholipase L1-like esterase